MRSRLIWNQFLRATGLFLSFLVVLIDIQYKKCFRDYRYKVPFQNVIFFLFDSKKMIQDGGKKSSIKKQKNQLPKEKIFGFVQNNNNETCTVSKDYTE